jgi:hypothetical protein
MTEDYKKNLLDYVTGNIQEGTPTTDEIIKEIIEVNRSKWTKYLPNGWTDFHFEGIIQDNKNDALVLYGGYRELDSTEINNKVYGIIIILDNNFNPIKTFYEYNNGTKLRYIKNMKQAEDGTYYMVDDTNFAFKQNDTILSSTKRLVMLNNFTTNIDGSYVLVFRTSYTFPSGYNVFQCENLDKNPNQAQYVMVGSKYEDGANSCLSVACVTLTIPYGESPTWDMTTIIQYDGAMVSVVMGRYSCSNITFSGENYAVKLIAGYIYGIQGSTTKTVRYYSKGFNSNTYNYTELISNDDLSIPYQDIEDIATFISDNECYFVMSNLESPGSGTQDLKIQLWHYKISTNTLDKVYENSYGTAVASHNEQIYLSYNQGYLYIEQVINKGNNKADYYVQRYEGKWNPIQVGEDKPYYWNQRALYVNNKFNLVTMYLYPCNPRNATWYFPIVKEVFNPTQYNGEPYENKDSLSPLLANLYSNGSLVFSRNLYNISKQNNTTMSSVEIPNTYLNDLTITQNDLISKTNLQMISDLSSWNKNIYEVVDLNFLNTISVIDEDTDTQYLDSAIKVNNATTDGGDANYQNTPCNKYRINYADNTTSIKPLYWSAIDDTHKQTMISFYVDKAIASIDFISNDETTIYLNIPVEVEVGNYYSLSEKIRIGV